MRTMKTNLSGGGQVPVKVIVVTEVTGYYDDNLWERSGCRGTSARDLVLSPKKRALGLYKRLLEERAEEEQRRGGPLPRRRSLDSKVLARRLQDAIRSRRGTLPTYR
jgi:hypothetical protein